MSEADTYIYNTTDGAHPDWGFLNSFFSDKELKEKLFIFGPPFALDSTLSIYSKYYSGRDGKYAEVDSYGWMHKTWFFGYSEYTSQNLDNWTNSYWIANTPLGRPILEDIDSVFSPLPGSAEVTSGSARVETSEDLRESFTINNTLSFSYSPSIEYSIISFGSSFVNLSPTPNFSKKNLRLYKKINTKFIYSEDLGWIFLGPPRGVRGAWFYLKSRVQNFKTSSNQLEEIGWVFSLPAFIGRPLPFTTLNYSEVVAGGATYTPDEFSMVYIVLGGLDSWWVIMKNSNSDAFIGMISLDGRIQGSVQFKKIIK